MITDPYNYIGLIEEFLKGKIPAKEFDDRFFETIGNDRYQYSKNGEEAFFNLIDELCYFVDDYVDDEVFSYEDAALFEREEGDLDEDQLRAEVTRIYKEIQKLK